MWNVDSIVNCPRVREMSFLSKEVFVALYLFPDRIVGSEFYDRIGTEDEVLFPDITKVIQYCIKSGTNRIVLVHNHPMYSSGKCDPVPSDSDIQNTIIYRKALTSHNIILEDHIIVTPKNYFSFRANNMLDDDKKKKGLLEILKSLFF